LSFVEANMSAATPKLRDERLCWLAVEDKLERRAKRGTGLLIGFSGMRRRRGRIATGGLAAQDTARGFTSAKMRKFAVAVDTVATRLSAPERETLRATGAVPEWFLADVLTEARKVKLR